MLVPPWGVRCVLHENGRLGGVWAWPFWIVPFFIQRAFSASSSKFFFRFVGIHLSGGWRWFFYSICGGDLFLLFLKVQAKKIQVSIGCGSFYPNEQVKKWQNRDESVWSPLLCLSWIKRHCQNPPRIMKELPLRLWLLRSFSRRMQSVLSTIFRNFWQSRRKLR